MTELVKKIRQGTRGFYVLTGPWGVGKSSALQFISNQLAEDKDRKVFHLRLGPAGSVLEQIRTSSNPRERQ